MVTQEGVVKKHWIARNKETKLKNTRYLVCIQEGISCNSEERTLNPRIGVPSIIKTISVKISICKTKFKNITKSIIIHKEKLEGTHHLYQIASQRR